MLLWSAIWALIGKRDGKGYQWVEDMPAEMVAMVEAAEAGDFAGARNWHRRLLPLMQVNFVESNPIPVKAVLAMMGLIEEQYRLPLVPPSPPSRARLRDVILSLGLINGDTMAERTQQPEGGHA